jgi:serine/threonine-protein kinase
MSALNYDNQENILDEAVQEYIESQLKGEEPDIDEFAKKYPQFEHRIREKIQNLQKVNTLFDSLVQTDENEFEDAGSGRDLVGEKVGNFQVEKKIGHGGMGVVYLAHDTKLDRSVAIKSMPVELRTNSTAQMRLKREARLLASLSHPNIAVIHDIINQDDGSDYLVLEYIPGQTLAERIARKPLKLEEILSIAKQIAEALLGAYEQGVTHRDIKPGNIKITPTGRVKVLDFGLAKTFDSQNENTDIVITQPGRIIGTPAYMSPEQLRGDSIDHRSDIWSFGCVIYEMLTGHFPFEGKTATDIVARILEREPDWQALPENTPANIRVMLRRCLEKDVQQRLQHIGDVIMEIRETINLPAVEPPSITPTATTQTTKRQRLLTMSLFCLLLISVVVCILLWNRGTDTSSPGRPVRSYFINPETDIAMEALWHHALAFSPDGEKLAYVEQADDRRRKIHVRLMDDIVAKPLAGTEGAISPFFSPDGEWIGYVDHFHRELKKVSSKGGNPMVLTGCVHFRGGVWSEDGTIIFCPDHNGGLWRISASGEGLKQLTVPDASNDERGHIWPSILPDGKTVLFTTTHTEGLDEYQIEIYSLESGERRILFKGGHYARHVSTGHLLYARRESLYAVGFDLNRLETTGDHVQIRSDVMSQNSRSSQFTCSDDGSLAYIPVLTRSTELKPVWVDKEGTTQPLSITPRNYHSVRISPDGARIAFTIQEGDSQDIWIYDLSHPTLIPLTSNGKGLWPVWLADSKRLVFYSMGTLVWQHADGSGQPRLIASGNIRHAMCCSPDGKELLVDMWDSNEQMQGAYIGVLKLDKIESNSPAPFIQKEYGLRHAVWSSDGKWVAYYSEETGSWEIYVEPYPGPGPKTRISTQGGTQPIWAKDSNELYYRNGDKIMAVSLDTESELKVLDSKILFQGNYLFCLNCQTYDIAPDGRFLMLQDPIKPATPRINVILNWAEQLKHLVPKEKE